MAEEIPDENAAAIEAAIFSGQKILAIREYRARTGKGLREAKVFVEALEMELRRTSPERFSAPVAKGCGTTALIAFSLVAMLAFAVTGLRR